MRSYHRVVAEVDLDAIEHNYLNIQHHIGDRKICAVIKADGYGHGAIPIAKSIKDLGVGYFAVASVQEAVALRHNGIQQPILILGYTDEEDFEDLIRHRLIQTIFRMDMAEKLSRVAQRMNQTAIVHIKIDTGMNRIGFSPDKTTVERLQLIERMPNIKLEGLFSHFSRADETDQSQSHEQINKFETFIALCKAAGLQTQERHMANSAGTIEYPEAHYDLVRVGIALYGLYPSEEVDHGAIHLKPALTLKSNVILLKEVPANQPISYGGCYITTQPTMIATIPVGYGDGYPRRLSNKGHVLIRGQRAPILGRVCMDQFMVDVTHIHGVMEGDEVVLIGQQLEETISVEEIANHIETIHYEVVCQLGKRIPRLYIRNQQAVELVDYF